VHGERGEVTMIIEFFGPPGVGKTTLARTLAARLRDRGHDVKLVLSYRPSESPPASRAERLARLRIPAALQRLTRPLAESFAATHSGYADKAGAAAALTRLLAPRKFVWSLRLRQYMHRLSCTWRDAALSRNTVLFDQGFVQAVYTFALLARAADRERLGLALNAVPEANFYVRLDAPLQILEGRLAERRRRQGRIEQLLDAWTDLGSGWIFDQLYELLQARGRFITCLDASDRRSLAEGVDEVEGIVLEAEGKVLAASAAGQNGAGS
jgi:thymidylate kinase